MRRDPWNFPSLHCGSAHDAMFAPEAGKSTKVMNLAIKIIKGGSEFTPEELQLQQNEPEALEKMLRDLKEFMEK